MEVKMPNIQTREEACQWAVMRVRALIAEETDCVTNMANTAAAIFEIWKDVSWAGFYRMKNGELVLGPFCGKPACRRIKVGSGVCGTAVSQKKHSLCRMSMSSRDISPVMEVPTPRSLFRSF